MMASMRVRQGRRRPLKRRQPFGGSIFGNTWIDLAAHRGAKGLFRLTNYARRKAQKGGRINAYIKGRTSM